MIPHAALSGRLCPGVHDRAVSSAAPVHHIYGLWSYSLALDLARRMAAITPLDVRRVQLPEQSSAVAPGNRHRHQVNGPPPPATVRRLAPVSVRMVQSLLGWPEPPMSYA